MAISGLVAAGVSNALEQVLERRLKEALRQQQEREHADQLSLQRDRLTADIADREAQRELAKQTLALTKARVDNDLGRERTQLNAASDMAGVLAMPGMSNEAKASEIMGSGLRTGSVDPAKVIEGLTRVAPPPKYTPALRIKGQSGRGEYRQFEEGQIPPGTEIYDEPKGASGVAKPKVDIRNVPERGPNGEPGTRVISFNDGQIVSSQWFPGNPSAGERGRMADTESSLSSLDALEQTFRPDFVGPVSGRLGQLGQAVPGVPVDKDQAAFYAASAAVRNAIIKAITGAQMSEPEARRITSQIPMPSDKPEVWSEKLKQSRLNAERLEAALLARQGLQEPQVSGDFSVTAPNGKTYTFKSAEELAAFKAKAKIP